MNLIIDGVEITFISSTELKQKLSPVNDGVILRMADGTAVKQYPAWGKLKTEINGAGWLPDGLSGIDFSSSVVMDCIAQRSITSASNIIAISDTVRPDLEPWGAAYVNGQWVDTSNTSWTGGTLTLTTVSGATKYQARWMPRLTMLCNQPETETDNTGAVYAWTLYGEEA